MSIFSFKFRDVFQLTELEDKEYELVCLEFNKVVNTYEIKTELYSSTVWEYLTKTYNIIDESDIMTTTEIEMDEKNKKHKLYKYLVKCRLDAPGNEYVYIGFNDELRGYEDGDYHGYVTEDDKSNKIFGMTIYYDSDVVSTKKIESGVVKELLSCAYLPSTKNQFFTISTNQFGFSLKASYIKDMKIDLQLNYGEKFLPIHDKIYDNLKNKSHGLFLLHGEPGTGKCVDEETFVTLRDKKTGEIMKITIKEFNEMNK